MPNVRNIHGSSTDAQPLRWLPPPSLPVREHAQIHNRGTHSPWPFLYSYREDGRCVVNTGPRASKYQEALAVGEAQF